MRHASSLIVVLLFIGLSIGSAAGDEPDARARSRARFVEGVAALDDSRPGDALKLFEQAYELFPHYSTLFNIGLCQRSLGEHAAAATSFKRFLDEGGAEIPPDERARVTELLTAEQARVPPPSSEARVDRVQAEAPLRESPPRETRPPPSRFDLPFWTATGASGLGFATFGVFGSLALVQHSAYDDATSDAAASRHRSQGRGFGVVADLGLIVGVASAAVAAYLAVRPVSRAARR